MLPALSFVVFLFVVDFSLVVGEDSTPGTCRLGSYISSKDVTCLMRDSDCSCNGEGPQCEKSYNHSSNAAFVPPHLRCEKTTDKGPPSDCFQIYRNGYFTKPLFIDSQPVILNCFVCGSPPLDITWYRENGLLPRGAQCLPESNGTMLHIRNMTEDDCGTYVCVARNMENKTFMHRVHPSVIKEHVHLCETVPTSAPRFIGSRDLCETVPTSAPRPIGSRDHTTVVPTSPAANSSHTIVGLVVGIATAAAVCVAVIVGIAAIALCKKGRASASSISTYVLLRTYAASDITGTVYISYACDSDSHRENVRQVAIKLRAEHAIECHCFEHDRDEAREQFVFHWVASKIKTAAAFIVICSPEYKDIADLQRENEDLCDDNDLEVSEGVRRTRAEWRHIRDHAYVDGRNCCIPVFIGEFDRDCLPLDLTTADPLCWPEQEKLVVDRLYSLMARDDEAGGQFVNGVVDP